jgi:protein phosphatase
MVQFDIAKRASKGGRAYQEDYALVRSVSERGEAAGAGESCLYIAALADGMGGHAGGALASEAACTAFAENFLVQRGDVPLRLFEALYQANDAIADRVAGNPRLAGMGCTLIGAAFGQQGVEWVSVGDSPLFLVRGGEIALLNEDHSLAPEIDKLAAAGKISREAAKADPRRHFLRSAITGGEIEMLDRSQRPLALQAGDVVILASDGIQTLDDSDILAVVTARAGEDADSIAESLLTAAVAAGDRFQDNTTVVVVRVTADGAD